MIWGLYADDATVTVVSTYGGIDDGVKLMKCVINEWEERNHDAKEFLNSGRNACVENLGKCRCGYL